MRADTLWAVLTIATLFAPTRPFVQARLELSLLPSRNQDFAQMVAALQPDYRFLYERARSRRFGDLYLLSAVPVAPTSGPLPTDESYFTTERPTTGLVTSFFHERSASPAPVENALVLARLLKPGTLVFRCELFAGDQARPIVCEGRFDVSSGSLDLGYIDLLFDKTEDRLRKRPDEKCVEQLYQTERKQNECAAQGLIENFRCSVASKLYARHQCRSVAG